MTTMTREECKTTAKFIAESLKRKLGIKEDHPIGIILGTGWGNRLKIANEQIVSLKSLNKCFHFLEYLEGHKRELAFGKINGREVVALRGRIHLNEHPGNPDIYTAVRLQTQILMELGVQNLILTAAVGSLPSSHLFVGDIVLIDSFLSLFAPQMPLFAGEFCSPEDVLSESLRKIAISHKICVYGSQIRKACHAMVIGPYFEGRISDKNALSKNGADVVGMSILPEACVAALYPDVEVLAIGFVTNTYEEIHSHEENQKRVAKKSKQLSAYLKNIIEDI